MIPAPELHLGPAFSPWLSRTAGRRVLRPTAFDAAAVRIRGLIDDLGKAFTEMQPVTLPAVQASQAFGEAIARARWP